MSSDSKVINIFNDLSMERIMVKLHKGWTAPGRHLLRNRNFSQCELPDFDQ